MRIAVAGGTGVVGSMVVSELSARGHEPVVLARSRGVDLLTGEGLDLTGCDAVIDAINSPDLKAARTQLPAMSARLTGTPHHVLLSIVGIDGVPFPYYEAKVAQEAVVDLARSTVLRTTQFHEFAGQVLLRGGGPVALVPRMKTQPIAAREVAVALVDLAVAGPQGRVPDLAGPEVHELASLSRRLLRQRGSKRRVLRVPLPGAAGKAMSGGRLLPTGPGPRGVQTFTEWLALQ